MRYSKTYHDTHAIQRLVLKDAKEEECDPKTRCLLARAFKELEELKLRLRMKPAPKPIDTTKLPTKQKRAHSAAATEFSES